jgi:hypothetical protein
MLLTASFLAYGRVIRLDDTVERSGLVNEVMNHGLGHAVTPALALNKIGLSRCRGGIVGPNVDGDFAQCSLNDSL